MMLLEHWKKSLSVFLPNNIGLFVKLTANTIFRSAKTWWYILACYIAIIVTLILISTFVRLVLVVWSMLHIILFWLLSLSVRPSVMKKNYVYYIGYWKHLCFMPILYLFGFLLIVVLRATHKFFGDAIVYVLRFLLLPIFQFDIDLYLFGLPTINLFVVFLSPILLLWTLAFLDIRATVSNIFLAAIRTGKLIMFNYPFVWIVSLAGILCADFLRFYTFKYATVPLIALISIVVVIELVYWLLLLVFLSILSNMYTRQVHEQFDWYYY